MGAKLNIPSNIETYSKQSRRRSRRKQARRNRRRQQRLSGTLKNKLVPNLHPDNAASKELSDFSDCDFSDYDLKNSKMHRNSPSSNNRTPSEGSEPTKRKNRHVSSDNETDYESDSSASSEPDNEENVSESKTTLPKNVTSSKGNDSSSKTNLNSSDEEIENANSEPNAPCGKKIKRIVESQPESNRTERSALKNEKNSLKEKGPSRLIDRQHSSDSEIAKNISDSNMSSESVRKSSQSRRSDSSDLASEQDEEMLNRSKANIENTRNREGESGGGHESNLKSEEPKTNSSEIEVKQDDVTEFSSPQSAKKRILPVLSKSSRKGSFRCSATPKISLLSKSRKSSVKQAAKAHGIKGGNIIKKFQQEQELKHGHNKKLKESTETDSLREINKETTDERSLGLATTPTKNKQKKGSKKKRDEDLKESAPNAENGITISIEKTISPNEIVGKSQISDVIELHPGSDGDCQNPQNETPREEIFTRSKRRSSSCNTPEKMQKSPGKNTLEARNADTNQGQKMLEGGNCGVKHNSKKGKPSLFDSPNAQQDNELDFTIKPRGVNNGTQSKNVSLPLKLSELDAPRNEDSVLISRNTNGFQSPQIPSGSVQRIVPTHRVSRNHKNDEGNPKTLPKSSTQELNSGGRPPSHSPSQKIEALKEKVRDGNHVGHFSYDTSDYESDNVSQFTKRFPREAVCNTSYKRNRKLSSPEHPAYNFGERLTSDSSPTEERRNMKRRRVKPSRSLSSRESPSPTIQRSVTERIFSKAQNVPSNHVNTVCSAPRLPHKDSHTKPVSRDFDDGAQSPLDYDYIPNDTMYSQRIDNSNSESERFYRLVNSAGDDRDGKQAGRRTEPPSRSRYLSIQWAQGPLKSCNQDFEFSEGSVPRSPTKRSRDSTYDSRLNENENRVRQPPDFLLAADDHIVDWDNPTYFDGENSHGVLCNIEPDIAYQKAAAWSNSLRKIMVQAPISILKKKSQIESSVKNAARQVRTFDAISTTSAMILTRSTVHIIKNFICSNFWEGEPCDKSCGKKHKINCDEFPSVSTDEVFQAVSDRLMEMEHPSIEMTNSFLEWLSDHHENIKMLSFSKILFTNNKGFNSLTKICELLVKYLARSYNCENYRMVEFLLKFHYVMVKKNPELAKTVVNKLIGYSQVGTYRHKVYEIVRFLLDVDGFSLQFKILDKLLYEVIANPPPDILILKEKIKRQLKSYEKAEDPDFRARAYRFLLTYFPETTRPPINQ